MSDKLEAILLQDEKVLWKNKPHTLCFLLKGTSKFIPFLILLMLSMIFAAHTFKAVFVSLLEPIFFVFGVIFSIPLLLFVGVVIINAIELRNVVYAITDKRIITRNGIFGIDFQEINYSDVSNIYTNVSVFEKLCKAGSVFIITASGRGVCLFSVKDPYKVSKIANEAFSKTELNLPDEN